MTNPLYDRLFGQHLGNDRAFLILPDGSTISFDGFLRMAHRYANLLTARGLAPGDRVAMQVPKSPEALAVTAAAVAAGIVFLPLNTAYTAPELDYFIGNSGAGLVLCDPASESALAPIASRHGASLMTLGAKGEGSFPAAAEGLPETFAPVERTREDLAALLYTSGTTGRSKGAMLTQNNLLSNAEALADLWRFTRDDVLLHALPIFHTHGLFVATNTCLLAGAQMILMPKFNTAEALRLLPQATVMMGVPTFYTRLLDDPGFDRAATAHMRLFVSGSAPLLADTHRQFEDRTGHRILERYGMTETNMTCSNPYEGERRPGTVGFALPEVEIRVCDPSGKELPQGEIGTLEVRGPNVFSGYWQMPEKTAAEFRPDGFFITGDLSRIDADGYVHIVGRGKDLIISGGFNVYPKEIEELLDAQPGVLESAVIGVPHPDFGEVAVGLLAREPGAAPDLAAIEADLAAKLARFKHPKRLIVVDELPRNTMGKVQKAALRAEHAGLFA
ncbi:malonate--CoA ligase [Frigidibacter sp. ROC022]|uniref:malonate--CoA ligase n=1 Tax=Frigidibacter sp. ROC022 TaxID=2971796 RepID=UPI00215AD5A7|nr:malonyl-CoA synthase [Frigidibacter sp. ROC022]MCR8724221.1 malonyl-CoA synthase [Frigidibacter sp. ROC022]